MPCPKPKYRIVIWSISNCDTACLMSVLGKSYDFNKTSQSNELAEETGVGFDHTTSSFRPEIFLEILRYVLFSMYRTQWIFETLKTMEKKL